MLSCSSNVFTILFIKYHKRSLDNTNKSNLEITMLWHISFFQPLASLWHTYVILMRYQNDNVLPLRVKWTKIVAFWNKISRLLVTFRFLTTSGTYKQTICQKSMPFRWQHWVCLKQPVLTTKSIFRLQNIVYIESDILNATKVFCMHILMILTRISFIILK